MRIPQLLQVPDKIRRHAMNLEGDQLIRVQRLQIFRLDVPREFQAHIVDGHRQLSFVIDSFETEGLHLLWILRVRREMKQPRALTVSQKSLAVEFPGVPRNRKMNFLPPRLPKFHSRE